jgi:ComF family protein
MNIIRYFKSLFSLFYPPLCVGCADALLTHEGCFCSECLENLPTTASHLHPENPAKERLAGKIPIERATAYLYYNKEGLGQKTVAEIKYHGNQKLGRWMGTHLAQEILPSGFFDGIDFLIPVPLHPKKLRQRGFNQAERLAQGISEITHIPVETTNLYRGRANETQTKKSLYERWKNTQGIFQIHDTQSFENKHLLLIDDVLTTGSTLEACAQALLKTKNVQISVLTLAIA